MMKFVVAALALFAALVVAMSFSQAELLFPTHAVPRAGPLPEGADRLTVVTPGGEKLEGVHFRPASGGSGGTLVLGFGGNAWNAQHAAEYLHELFPGEHVVAFHYRGYSPSTGSPSAEALLKDAPLVYDAAVERVRPERTVAVGLSIGGGVAASLAHRRDVDGLILVTPFDSLKAVAQSLYPWLPVGAFFQHEIATAEYLEAFDSPVAVVAADRDEIVPAERTEALRRRLPNIVYDATIERAGHNDIYGRADFELAMREAMQAVAAGRANGSPD